MSQGSQQPKPEFSAQMEDLKTLILNRITPLRLGDKGWMRGCDYVTLARTYAQALNQGAVPTISDAWSEVYGGQARRAIERAASHYKKELKKFLS